jgi:hypothetical protein
VRNDVVAIVLEDPREVSVPDAGWIDLVDAESGQRMLINSGDRATRGRLQALGERRREERSRILARAGVDQVLLDTRGDYAGTLRRAFAQRARRQQR